MADRPPYQPWYEGDFWSSLRVRTMHPMARLMYRALLQAAWDQNPPCRIPNKLETIRAMADCPHPKQWEAHGPAVMAMFDVSEDGAFITNARQLQELAKTYAKTSSYRLRGKKGQQVKQQRKHLKTISNDLAELKNSTNSAEKDGSNQPNPVPTQPSNKKLSSTSFEVDASRLLSKYSEEEQCAIAEVWPYYLEKCDRDPKRYELTPQRITKAIMRFREARKKTGTFGGAIALMKEAVDNLAANDWNMGRDPKGSGKRYVDFVDHLFGSWTEMEKRLNDRPTQRTNGAAAPKPVSAADADRKLSEQLGGNYAKGAAK